MDFGAELQFLFRGQHPNGVLEVRIEQQWAATKGFIFTGFHSPGNLWCSMSIHYALLQLNKNKTKILRAERSRVCKYLDSEPLFPIGAHEVVDPSKRFSWTRGQHSKWSGSTKFAEPTRCLIFLVRRMRRCLTRWLRPSMRITCFLSCRLIGYTGVVKRGLSVLYVEWWILSDVFSAQKRYLTFRKGCEWNFEVLKCKATDFQMKDISPNIRCGRPKDDIV